MQISHTAKILNYARCSAGSWLPSIVCGSAKRYQMDQHVYARQATVCNDSSSITDLFYSSKEMLQPVPLQCRLIPKAVQCHNGVPKYQLPQERTGRKVGRSQRHCNVTQHLRRCRLQRAKDGGYWCTVAFINNSLLCGMTLMKDSGEVDNDLYILVLCQQPDRK